jgi:O-antigen ligase
MNPFRKITFIFTLILVFSIPWQNMLVLPGMGTITRAIGLSAIIVALFLVILEKRIKEIPLVILIMIVFVLWNIITYFWSINPGRTIGRVVTYTQLLAMVWLIWQVCKTNDDYMRIIQAYILGSYVAIFDMMVSYFSGQASDFRIAATGFNPNWLAISLALGIPMAWHLLYKKHDSKLFLFLNTLYIPLTIFAIILTASRGGLIATVVGLTVIPITFFHQRTTVKLLISTLFVIIIFISIIAKPTAFENLERNIERLMGTGEMIQTGQLNYRDVIWRAGFKVFSENSIIGVGSGSYSQAVESLLSRRYGAHNAYLSVLVDTGIIGIILFLLIMVVSIIPNMNSRSTEKYFYLILLLTLIIGLIPANMEYHKATWLVFILLSSKDTLILRDKQILKIRAHQ